MRGWVGVARFGGVGDNLVASSVLRPLKRMGYMIEVLTSPMASVVFLNNPFVDKLTVKQDGDIPGGEIGTQWFVTRSKEYDQFFHLSYSMEVRHALQQQQTAFWWPAEYRRKLCAGSYLETVHDICNVPHDFGPLFFPTEEEQLRAVKTRDEQIGGNYVSWVLSGSRIDKTHPYSALAIARIITELKMPVVMFGIGGKQFEYASQTKDHVVRQNGSEKGLHLALSPDIADPGGLQSWGVRRSITQSNLGSVVVTPDTGLAWAAAMEQTPKVVMVSHASDENITKHWVNTITLHADPNRVPCWPCHRLHNDLTTCTPAKDLGISAACMADISVDQIMTAVEKSLCATS